MLCIIAGDYSSALGTLSQIVTESSRKDGPYQQLLHTCHVSQLLLLLLLKVSNNFLLNFNIKPNYILRVIS